MLLPAIVEKWPWMDQLLRKNLIQQDGAKSHISADGDEFKEALIDQNINAELYTQAANSPYVNLLDLGFFQAIQSFNDAALKNEEQLIQSVHDTYKDYP